MVLHCAALHSTTLRCVAAATTSRAERCSADHRLGRQGAASFWRPITAIREADTDGSAATEPDAGWLPQIPIPPDAEQPSGHTALSGSIVATLQAFFVVDARVWSGIHFRTADEQGERLGQQIARWRERRVFRPTRSR